MLVALFTLAAIPLPPGDDPGTVELRAKACTPVILARHGDLALVSGECHGNTMCGSFGFWLVDVRNGPMPALAGCFSSDPPKMRWATMTLEPPPTIAARRSCPARYDEVRRRWRITRCAP